MGEGGRREEDVPLLSHSQGRREIQGQKKRKKIVGRGSFSYILHFRIACQYRKGKKSLLQTHFFFLSVLSQVSFIKGNLLSYTMMLQRLPKKMRSGFGKKGISIESV